MTDYSPRHGLPYLVSGQSQKEVTHNEALALADALLVPVVEDFAPASPPSLPQPGQCWIAGAAPSGVWSGQDHALCLWTDGGWRFLLMPEGACVWNRADGIMVQRTAAGWDVGIVHAAEIRVAGNKIVGSRQPAIADAGGGAIVDLEARIALNAVLSSLRAHGLIASGAM